MSLLILVDFVLMRLQLCPFKFILGQEGALGGLGRHVATGWSNCILFQNSVVYELISGQASETKRVYVLIQAHIGTNSDLTIAIIPWKLCVGNVDIVLVDKRGVANFVLRFDLG